MTFYVFKAIGRRSRLRLQAAWELVSEHDDLAAAETAAEALCPKGQPITTEPGKELKRAFFGSAHSDYWSARISKEPTR